MKNRPLLLVALGMLAATVAAEKIDLGAGQAALLTVPDTWIAAPVPGLPPGSPAVGTTRHYVTKNGSNDSVVLSLVPVPDDRLAAPENLKEMVAEASQQFVAGSVEGKVNLKDFKIGGASGFTVTFTDATLVGQPAVKDNFKMLTSCHVYLGNEVLLTATILTDDVNGKSYAEAMRILKSFSMSRPGKAI